MPLRAWLTTVTLPLPLQLLEDCNLCAIHAKRVTISECLLRLAGLTSLEPARTNSKLI